MRRLPHPLEGPVLLEPLVHRDDRGFFLETYRRDALAELGVTAAFVQGNHSRSGRGVVRGMHFSVDPGQAKLVRCARGEILDVVVDIRRGSPAFGRWAGVTLDDREHRTLYVPVGFAHGFAVVSEVADVVYDCSEYYESSRERGFAPDDPRVGIAWPPGERVVSARDAAGPALAEIADDLPFVYAAPAARATASRPSVR